MDEPMTRQRQKTRPPCPRCGSGDVAWILRGYPAMDEELDADLDARRVILGGCLVWPDQSDHRCNTCGFEFRKDGRPVRIPEGDA